jgi:uncharacterized protein (DUF952 family)
VAPIFHITRAEDWAGAVTAGEYRMSTLGKTLDDVGFIHCSQTDQVERVANAAFAGADHLVVLVIDPDRVAAPITYENLEGGVELFPHIYGPLGLDAVDEVMPFDAGPDGRFSFPGR